MAIKFFDCNGFGQLECNQVSFDRDGRVEAQCDLDNTVFASHFPMTKEEATKGLIYGEVGAFLMVDKAKGIATVPTDALNAKGLNMGINYSTEKIYNQFTPGRRNFCQVCDEFYPRIGYTEPGERITTNTVAWETSASVFTTSNPNDDSDIMYNDVKNALAAGTEVYAYVVEGSDGKLTIGADKANALGKVYAHVVKAYTNADGSKAFMFEFINEPA